MGYMTEFQPDNGTAYVYEGRKYVAKGRSVKYCPVCGNLVGKGTPRYSFQIYNDEWNNIAAHEECANKYDDDTILNMWINDYEDEETYLAEKKKYLEAKGEPEYEDEEE